MKKRTYTDEQVELLRKSYPEGRWDLIQPIFPNKSHANIRAIARKHGIRMKREFLKDSDLTGQRFGLLTALRPDSESDSSNWICRCECGKECSVQAYLLIKRAKKSCGCLKRGRI